MCNCLTRITSFFFFYMPFGWHFDPELLVDLRVHTCCFVPVGVEPLSLTMFTPCWPTQGIHPVSTAQYTSRKTVGSNHIGVLCLIIYFLIELSDRYSVQDKKNQYSIVKYTLYINTCIFHFLYLVQRPDLCADTLTSEYVKMRFKKGQIVSPLIGFFSPTVMDKITTWEYPISG